MGSTEDPKDGAEVAKTIFGAVIVYVVSAGVFSQSSCVAPRLERDPHC